MGCVSSRVANEDTVRRCKERRRLMKDAVLFRHHLAAAHSDYLRSLRNIAAALSFFASFQTLSVSDNTPPVLLRSQLPPPPSTTSISLPPPTPLPLPPTPPAPPPVMPMEVDISPPPHYKKKPFSTMSAYSTTTSQTSSAWDWENFYPPSPPGSDYFDRLNQSRREADVDDVGERSERDGVSSNYSLHQQHHLPEEDDEEEELNMFNTSSTKSGIGEDDDVSRSEEMTLRSDYQWRRHHFRCGGGGGALDLASPARMREERDDGSSALVGDLKMVVRHRDLKEIVAGIEEFFVKAADAGDRISDLLETGPAQLDRSFRQLKKTVYHSSSVLSNLSSTWSSKPPLAIKYSLDTAAPEDSGKKTSHCSTLERLLAWEKKLYEEVKAREGVKIEHQKKLSALRSQEYTGKAYAKLEKIKISMERLRSLILVTSQAVSTTSSEIIKVRDNELAPQLVELCYGFMNMWRSMNHFHEIQNQIVQQVRGLVNYSVSVESTCDLHRQATRDLESAVTDWHLNFTRLIKFQREYIRALHTWLKLTLFQVGNDESEKDHFSSLISSELLTFCDEWRQALDRLPDTVAAEAIKSFATVIHSITLKQNEELKIKKRVECYSKELEKKSLALRSIERKFYQSYSTVGIGLPDGSNIHGQVFDVRDPLAEKKSEIVACRMKVEEEMSRHTMAIKVAREMTLNNIQTGLPGVFQALSSFSGLFTEALERVVHRAHQ